MPRLTEVDQATGLAVRRPEPVSYEKTSPGELVHLDIKKLGRVPDGGGWRAHGRGSAPALAADRAKNRTRRRGGPVGGYRCIHHAIDDYSRVVYSEILDDERKETAAGFFQRANAFFKDLGITLQAVMTGNGACYRSRTPVIRRGDRGDGAFLLDDLAHHLGLELVGVSRCWHGLHPIDSGRLIHSIRQRHSDLHRCWSRLAL